MKFKIFLYLTIAALPIISCIKHEVIPAPVPKVELKSKFTGLINDVQTEYNEGVSGYTCVPTQDKNLLTSPTLSSAIYYSEISSATAKPAIRIGLGKINWDTGVSADPSLESFTNFFTTPASILPNYKDDCSSGFNVKYTDANGTIYVSHENSVNYQDVKFTNILQESDPNGDYNKFVCTFNCYVYYSSGPNPAIGLDSLKIQNAQLKGWFKK